MILVSLILSFSPSLSLSLSLFPSSKEYWNKDVSGLLRQWGIEQVGSVGTSKSCFVERLNKTIQVNLYKYLSQNETLRYIDHLQDFVSSYNNRPHRSLGQMTPNEAFKKKNRTYVRGVHMMRYNKIKRLKPSLAVGDMVRVKTSPGLVASSRRAYAEQFKPEYFKVWRVNTKLPIPLYYIQSMDTGEKIQGGFYLQELSKVVGDTFKIEKIIRWRTRRGKREGLARWAHFSSAHDSWVPEEDIVQVFDEQGQQQQQ